MSDSTSNQATATTSPVEAEGPLAHRVVRGGIWVAASTHFNLGFGFLVNIFLARILTPEQFGLFALAQFFYALINLRYRLPVGHALAQRKEITGKLVGSHLVLDITLGLLTVVIAGAAIPLLPVLLPANHQATEVAWVVLVLACVGVSDSITGTASVLLDKELRFGATGLLSSLVFGLSYLPTVWLAVHGGGYWSLVAQNATYSVLLLIGMWWIARRQLPRIWRLQWRFDRRVAVQLARFGAVVGLTLLAEMVVGQFDNFLVGTFVGLAMLGLYDRAYGIAQWPSQLVTAVINRAAFYAYTRLQDDRERLQKTVTMSIWLIAILALPLAVGIFAAAPDLVRLFYGVRWVQSALFVRFLVILTVIAPLSGDASLLFTAVGRPHLSVILTATQAVVLATAGIPLTMRFGAVGTCVTVGIMCLVGLGVAYHFRMGIVDLQIWRLVGLPTLSAVLALGGYLWVEHLVDLNALPLIARVLGKLVFVSSAYLAIMFVAQPREMVQRALYVWQLMRAKG
jgi:lipopolysaccharide exporter